MLEDQISLELEVTSMEELQKFRRKIMPKMDQNIIASLLMQYNPTNDPLVTLACDKEIEYQVEISIFLLLKAFEKHVILSSFSEKKESYKIPLFSYETAIVSQKILKGVYDVIQKGEYDFSMTESAILIKNGEIYVKNKEEISKKSQAFN